MARNNVTNNLVALGSAAVLTVYAAGYVRTRPAAQRFAVEARERAPVPPPSPVVVETDTADPAPAPAPAPSAETKPVTAKPPPKSKAIDTVQKVIADTAPTPDSSVVVAQPDTVAQAPVKPLVDYKDGTYTGWGTSRHGEIKATVEIKEGRIISATITQCLTQYSCSWISELPGQVVARQSPETDYVSGATQSTNAFYYAVVQALSKAK